MDPIELINESPILADRIRLAILATLSSSKEPVDFMSLVNRLELTKGNLSTHLRKLEDAKLIKVTKEFIDRKPKTTYTCTQKGRKEMTNYLTKVESLLKMVIKGK